MFKEKKNDDVSINLVLVGGLSLLSLIFLMGLDYFVPWLFDELVWYFISAFFLLPIANIIINRNVKHIEITELIIGGFGTFIYAWIDSLTPLEVIIELLKTMAILTILYLLFTILKRKI